MEAGGSPTETGWYPGPPPSGNDFAQAGVLAPPPAPPAPPAHVPHALWSTKRYLQQNDWSKVSREERERVRRNHIHGVEVRDLPVGHKLHGEQGLFATRKYEQFDVLGEYTGLIVGKNCFGHYVASLEDTTHDESLGIDAEKCGNEMRFINSHLNIAFTANVTMRTLYLNTLPHIVLVCTTDIEPGEEFLLDYGAVYNAAYLSSTPRTVTAAMTPEASAKAWSELAGGGGDSESEGESGGGGAERD